MSSPLKDIFRKTRRGGGGTTPQRHGGAHSPPDGVPAAIEEGESLRQSQMDLSSPPSQHLIDVAGDPLLMMTSSGMTVRSMKKWDVRMGQIKKNMVRGHLVPTVQGAVSFLMRKKRQVSIEVRGPTTTEAEVSAGGSSPKAATKAKEGLVGASPKAAGGGGSELADGEVLFFRVFKLKKKGAREEDDDNVPDDASVESDFSEILGDDCVEWKEHRSYKLEDVSILKTNGKVLEIKTGSGNDTVVRDIKFDSVKDAEAFGTIVEKMMALERERTKRQIARYRGTIQQRSTPSGAAPPVDTAGGTVDRGGFEAGVAGELPPGEMINVLVEIVSATDLPVADFQSTDPYIIVRMAGKEVHRTKVLPKTLDPIWTLKTGSLFLLRETVEEFFGASGLSFVIKDYDALGKNESLGQVYVSLEELLNGTGERVGYDIIPGKGFEDNKRKSIKGSTPKKSRLYLRMREATDDDIKFMDEYHHNSNKLGVYVQETVLPFRPPQSKLLKRQTKRNEQLEQMHRVRPFPDPARVEETTWMTKKEIIEESMKPSTNWVEAGSGDMGKLYVEVLGCEKLPNMDSMTTNVRDKTDAFACLVFEDSLVMTEVIGDTLSPRWMPWSQRAFVINVSHPSSTLQLGLFDFDPELSPLQMISRAASDVHDPIGRIQIHLSNFIPDIEYTTAYPLYFGETAEQRQKQMGTVWVRFRTEWSEPRKAILAASKPPPPTIVSVSRGIDFQVAHYTTEGPNQEKDFNLNTLTGYIEELQSYEQVVDLLKRAAFTVWLWRGHYHVTICKKEYLLPLHSLTAFIWGIIVTYDFNTFPAFFLFSVGWAFIAISEYINKNPSPWHQCRSFGPSAFHLLAFNQTPKRTNVISANQNLEAIELYNKENEERECRWQREKELQAQHDEQMQKEMGEDMEQAEAEEDITSKKGGWSLNVNPFKSTLYPIQLQLRQLVIGMRIAKNVLMWEESYFAFWITTACFLGSFVLIWIPFGFLLRWILRIAAWAVLGPWMALVDRWKFREDPNLTDEQRDDLVRQRLRAQYEEVRKAATHYQIRKERAQKYKSMKKYMFGKFLLRVPRFSEDLFKDFPLPQSSAKPFDKNNAAPVHIERRIYGQDLQGDMIPERQIQARTGKAKQPKKKKRGRQRGESQTSEEKIPLLGRLRGKRHYESVNVGPEPPVVEVVAEDEETDNNKA